MVKLFGRGEELRGADRRGRRRGPAYFEGRGGCPKEVIPIHDIPDDKWLRRKLLCKVDVPRYSQRDYDSIKEVEV